MRPAKGVTVLAKPLFREAVLSVIGPALAAHGFMEDGGDQDTVWFFRVLRDHWNQISISRDELGSNAFEVRLFAPKKPHGVSLGDLPGGRPVWRCATEATLTVQLKSVRVLLTSEGLTWLDTFTPGNVPLWEGHLARYVLPLLADMGFKRRPQAPPDRAVFERLNDQALIIVDMQIPGRVQVLLYQAHRFDPNHHGKQSPVYIYRNEADFTEALLRAARFLENEARTWFVASSVLMHA